MISQITLIGLCLLLLKKSENFLQEASMSTLNHKSNKNEARVKLEQIQVYDTLEMLFYDSNTVGNNSKMIDTRDNTRLKS